MIEARRRRRRSRGEAGGEGVGRRCRLSVVLDARRVCLQIGDGVRVRWRLIRSAGVA